MLVGERMKLTKDDVIVLPVPLFHCFGCSLGNMAALNQGACMVYPSESWNLTATLEAIDKYNGTTIYGVPIIMNEIMNEHQNNPGKYKLSNLRKGLAGGTTIAPALMEKIYNFGITGFVQGFGQTESSPAVVISDPEDTLHNKMHYAGRPLPHTEIKIVDNDGNTVPFGTQGEVWVRGYMVMKGYLDNPEGTNQVMTSDGWLKTGDLGVLNSEGYLKIVGRKKDLIIRGGENIYPREIEDFLAKVHPNIQEVQVFGVPDERMDEEVCAWIKLKDKTKPLKKEDILQVMKDQISYYKIPKYVKFVDDIPMTGSGKALKHVMREAMIPEIVNPETAKEYTLR